MFEQSRDYVDLQALIMFLVFEKKVLSMEDDAEELDLYFLTKHNKRMNRELAAYKKKMNMGYKPYVFEIRHGDKKTYVYAESEMKARRLASKHLIEVESIRTCDLDELMNFEGKEMTLRTIIQNKKPQILGGY